MTTKVVMVGRRWLLAAAATMAAKACLFSFEKNEWMLPHVREMFSRLTWTK